MEKYTILPFKDDLLILMHRGEDGFAEVISLLGRYDL